MIETLDLTSILLQAYNSIVTLHQLALWFRTDSNGKWKQSTEGCCISSKDQEKTFVVSKNYVERKLLQCPQASSRITQPINIFITYISSSTIEDEHSLEHIIIEGTIRNIKYVAAEARMKRRCKMKKKKKKYAETKCSHLQQSSLDVIQPNNTLSYCFTWLLFYNILGFNSISASSSNEDELSNSEEGYIHHFLFSC